MARLESRPTRRALLYVVGSPCMLLFRLSMYVSFIKGPPTSAPVASFGFGLVDSSHWYPSLHPVVASAGIEAPLWCTNFGNFFEYPTR